MFLFPNLFAQIKFIIQNDIYTNKYYILLLLFLSNLYDNVKLNMCYLYPMGKWFFISPLLDSKFFLWKILFVVWLQFTKYGDRFVKCHPKWLSSIFCNHFIVQLQFVIIKVISKMNNLFEFLPSDTINVVCNTNVR